MRHIADESFWNAYEKLSASTQKQADAAFALLKANPYHPSLHFKRLRNTGRWSVRVGLHFRAVSEQADKELFVWFWIGTHAEYDHVIRE